MAESDDGTWLAGLCGITADQIAIALGKLVVMSSEWPPTLPEFRKICLVTDDDEMDWFIENYAMKGIQSFDRRQMSRKDEQRLISRHQEAATTAYLEKRMIINLQTNNLLEAKE